MNDDEIVRQGNMLIHEEARRKHEQIQWKHDEKMSEIACKNFGLYEVVQISVIFTIMGMVLGGVIF